MVRCLAFLLLFIFLSQPLYAQNSHYNVVNYTTDNGLPQNSITGIQFDRKGYCWLGTQMGLVRFDGQRFSLFGSDNIKGLRSDRILRVARDTAGTLFVSTWGIVNGLRINDSAGMSAPVPVLLSRSAPDIPTLGFVVPKGHIPITFDLPFQTFLGTAAGNMYVVQPGQSSYTSPSGKTLFSYEEAYRDRELLLIDESLLMLQAYNKTGLWTKGIAQPRPKLCGPLWTDPAYIRDNYRTPFCTQGAYVYTGNTLYQLRLAHDTVFSEVVLADISIPSVSCLYIDKPNNRFYFGTAVSGLFIVQPTDFYTPPVPDLATPPEFYSQALTEEGIFSKNILFRRDGSSTTYPIVRPNHHKSIWYRRENRSLYYAPDLTLCRLDLETGKIGELMTLQSRLCSLFPDPAHPETLLFSTNFSIGKMAQDTLVEEKVIQGLTKGQELLAVYPAGADTFLLATWSGVKWYDYRHNRIYRSVLDSLTVRQLYPESSQRIWMATYGKGWYLYDKGRIVRMPDGPLDALKTVNAIIDDQRGYFWLSSNNGLYKVSRQALLNYADDQSETVYFYAFSTKDHLPTNEFNACSPSYVWLPDSMLSLPSIKGLVWFYPYKIHLSLPDKGIYIEHIRMNQEELALDNGQLLLAPDHGRLSIQVSSPYFGNKENMQLQFRIEGLDDEWHEVAGDGRIIIDRMPAGTYSLVIRKVAGMEHGQYTRLTLPVRVLPHWYNTRRFYLLLLVVSAAFVYCLVAMRTRMLEARNRNLKTQVALQTRDLNRMVQQLTQSEEALKESNQTKDNVITTVLHDLRSPLRFIYMISKHVASDHRKMQQDMLDTHLQELKNSTASLNSFTEQFFNWAISQHHSFAVRYSQSALADIFTETESLYADIMSANGNHLIIMPTELSCYTDPQLLSAVIRNLLDNANKNTRNGSIQLAAAQSADKVMITVSDTGKGFTPEALKAFLDKDKTDAGSAKGSFIVLYLLDLIGGQLEAVSGEGKGTTFRITLSRRNSGHDNKPAG